MVRRRRGGVKAAAPLHYHHPSEAVRQAAACGDAMDRALSRPIILLAVLAVLVLALLHAMRGDGSPAGVQAMAADVRPGASVQASPARSGRFHSPGQTAGTGAATIGAPGINAPSLEPSLAEQFERAEDLHAYLQRLLPAARAGDAGAAWFVSRVYDYCAAHAANPAAYARDTEALGRMRLAASEQMIAARERVASRCRHFAPVDGLDTGLVIVKRLEAAEAGSLAAEASLLAQGEPLDESHDYRRGLVERVQASGDAEAFSALAPAMGLAASGEPAHAGQVAGTRQAELAWHLAACRLGMDCSAQGALMTAWCAHGGICPPAPHQDFEETLHAAAQPHGEEETIKQLSDSLLREGVIR